MSVVSIVILVLVSTLFFISMLFWSISIVIAKNKSKVSLSLFSKKVLICRNRYIPLVCSKFVFIDLFLIVICAIGGFAIIFIELNNKNYTTIDIVIFVTELISAMLLLSSSFFVDWIIYKSFKKTIINFKAVEIKEFIYTLEKENYFDFIKNSKKYKYIFIKKFLSKIKKDDFYNLNKNIEFRYLIKFIYVFISSINIMIKNKIFDDNLLENEKTIKIKNSIILFNEFVEKTFEFSEYKKIYKN